MYARLDDELLDHAKIFKAGKRLGPNGPLIATGMYAVCLMWTNRHLTNGVITNVTLETFPHSERPLAVAEALAHARLLDRVKGGYRVHHYEEHNPSARAIKAKRKRDRLRKRRERAQTNARE